MKKLFVAAALAVTLAQPASAVTFPSLTTIYVGAGISDHPFAATSVQCSNVSGATASFRILLLDRDGAVVGSHTANLTHGDTYTVSTRTTSMFGEDFSFSGLFLAEGVMNVESTNSGVFCTAKVVDPAASGPTGFSLHLVRVNPHPGTVE